MGLYHIFLYAEVQAEDVAEARAVAADYLEDPLDESGHPQVEQATDSVTEDSKYKEVG